MSDPVLVSEELVREGWELLTLVGGRHAGTKFWSHRPPREFSLTSGGPIYRRVRDGWYAAKGCESAVPAEEAPEQMELA